MQAASKFRLYWANKTINYSILILITLLGVVIPAWYFGQNTLITPLILGVIAAALAESDDSFMGRIKALILTFICFAVAAFSIEILFHTLGCLPRVCLFPRLALSCLAQLGQSMPVSHLVRC